MLSIFFDKKESSRKFVDLIKDASSKWANWDPPTLIEVGDFGTVDKKSGAFVRSGNLYREPSLQYLAMRFPVDKRPEVSEYCINTSNVKQRSFDAGGDAHTADGIASVSFKNSWQFSEERGALLVMLKPRLTVLPPEFLEACKDSMLLKRRDVVTEVFNCPAFAMYLSNKSSESVHLALKAAAPIAAGVTIEGQLDASWWSSGTAGVFQKAYRKEHCFTPLYQIRHIREFSRRRDDPKYMASAWEDTEVPWGLLDEDGEEEVDYSSDEEVVSDGEKN